MENENDYTFELKFWPDEENRECPSDECLLVDEPAMIDILRYRQQMRLYYLNWFDVWETYSYMNRFTILLAPLVFLLTWKWYAPIIVILLWIVFCRIIGRKTHRLWSIKILIPGLFDPDLTEHFGNLLPFTEK